MSMDSVLRDRAEFAARLAAVTAAIVAALVMNTLPVIIGTLTQYLPIVPSELGAFGSADLVGVTVGSWITSRLLKHVPLRILAAIGTTALLFANVLSAWAPSVMGLIVLRCMGGLGSGLTLGVCFHIFGLAHRERNLAAYLLGQTALAFLIILGVPFFTTKFGWQSVFWALGLVTVPAIVLTRWLPPNRLASPRDPIGPLQSAGMSLPVRLALTGTALLFLGQGALWTFLERIGAVSGIPEIVVTHSMAACVAFGFLSSGLVLLLGSKITGIAPLALSVLLNVGAVALVRSADARVFMAAISAFNFSLPILVTCQFAVVTRSDHTGRVAVHMSTASFGGFALGPYLGGLSVEKFGYASLQWIDAGMVLAAATTLLPLMLKEPSRTK